MSPYPPGSQTDNRSSARASIQSMGPPRVLLAAAIKRETASSPRGEAKTWSTATAAAGAEPSTGDGGEKRVRRDGPDPGRSAVTVPPDLSGPAPVWSRTVTVLEAELAVARSRAPSPLKSAAASATAPEPTR